MELRRHKAPEYCLFFLIAILSLCLFSTEAIGAIPTPVSGSVSILADFDADRQLDVAEARRIAPAHSEYRYRVHLRLSAQKQSISFTFSNTDCLGIRIAAFDVDGDSDIDLVISGRLIGQHIGVWLNDGTGSFAERTPDLYREIDNRSLEPFRPTTSKPAVNENVHRLFPDHLVAAGATRPSSVETRLRHDHTVDAVLAASIAVQRLRGPPPDTFPWPVR